MLKPFVMVVFFILVVLAFTHLLSKESQRCQECLEDRFFYQLEITHAYSLGGNLKGIRGHPNFIRKHQLTFQISSLIPHKCLPVYFTQLSTQNK